MTLTPEQAELLATDRWAWLGDHLARWCREPLTASDAESPEVLRSLRDEPDPLPEHLLEWLALVGSRVEQVEDNVASLDTFGYLEDSTMVWGEREGVWTVVADGDDGTAILETEFPWGDPPLIDALHGMLVSELLVGAWSAIGFGPLGRLADGVRGGIVEDVEPDELDAYDELSPPPSPLFPEPLRGDAATYLRCDANGGRGLEWVTADADAYAALDAVIPLEPPGAPHVVALAFAGLTGDVRKRLSGAYGRADTAWLTPMLAASDRLIDEDSGGGREEGWVTYQIESTQPEALVDRAIASIDAPLREHLTVARRPQRVAWFTTVFPEPDAGKRWLRP